MTEKQLKEKYFSSLDSVESRRWHLLWKISLGWSLKNSALAVGISYIYAKKIIQKYNHGGENALVNGRKTRQKSSGGKKPLLTEKQFQLLIEQLESKPADGGVWTGPKVARWIEKETGKEKVWNQRGWDYLKKCRYSWQSPRAKHYKGDEKKQEEFKQNFVTKVKEYQQKYPDAEVEVWFFDGHLTVVKTLHHPCPHEHRVGLKPMRAKSVGQSRRKTKSNRQSSL